MSSTEFTPKRFATVELIQGEVTSSESLCTPGYPSFPYNINKISLNCPQEAIYHIDNIKEFPSTHKLVLPICLYYNITMRRSLKYHQLSHTIHIRELGKDEWYNGVVEVVSTDRSSLPNSVNKDKFLEKEREKAQIYSDSDLNTGQSSLSAKNFNLFDFLTFPVTSGRYEIYYSARGLESNRCLLKIIIGD